jgi:hypothetical protein
MIAAGRHLPHDQNRSEVVFMHRFGRLTAIVGAAIAVAGASAGSAAASPVAVGARVIPAITISSPVASGYAAVPKSGGAKAFNHVQDSYTVPGVNCGVTPNAVAQQRAGLDGITDNTIERVGISEMCQGPTATYVAWFQMYPAAAVVLFHPSPGDAVNSSVSFNFATGVYKFSVQDLTTGKTYTAGAKCASVCDNSSAQVTAGSPSGIAPADFAVVHFSSIIVTDTAGLSGGLANAAWATDTLTQSGSPHTVAGPLHTFAAPPPAHSAFADTWAP